jgi:signal transduction histidine kinase
VFKAAVSLAKRPRMVFRRQARAVALRDAGLAAALMAAALVPQLQGDGFHVGELPLRQAGALAVVLTAGQCVPLAVRRRRPGLCLTVVAGCFAAAQALAYPVNLASGALLVALYSAGAHLDQRFRRVLAVAMTSAYVAFCIVLYQLRSPERLFDYLTIYLMLVACWGAGAWVRARQAGEAERHRRGTELAIAQERARIARELHDVVTHHVTAMVVQADAAQYLVSTAPDRATGNLAAIADTGRQALAELRGLLGVLDAPAGAGGDTAAPAPVHAPAPGQLRELAARARRAGQPVTFEEDGELVALAAGPELAAYRVVQEALTNAVKHAPGQPTTVRIRYGDEVDISVTTDGPVIAADDFAAGRGLTGLRERVRTCGGELTAGGRAGGGFSVRARMPAKGAA